MVKLGDRIKILNRDGQYSKWTYKTWIVNDVASNRDEHYYYDKNMEGMLLVSCEGLPVSLYEYEFEVVNNEELNNED